MLLQAQIIMGVAMLVQPGRRAIVILFGMSVAFFILPASTIVFCYTCQGETL
jgi:hypothetical protein